MERKNKDNSRGVFISMNRFILYMKIKLRKIRTDDLKLFLKWWKDEDLVRLTSGLKETSNKALSSYFQAFLLAKEDKHFIISLGQKAIGHIALTRKNKDIFEINIVIGEKKYWGKGYGTEAIKKAVDYAFTKLDYKQAYLEVRPDNKRAVMAYKKCGFIESGYKKYPNNKFQPTVLKMILKK